MPKKSYPSSLISFVDIPEIVGIQSKFFYNFFVPDEGVNTSPNPTALRLLRRAGVGSAFKNIEGAAFENIVKRVPRFVKITWRPYKSRFKNAKGQPIRDMGIKANKDLIQDETLMSNGRFTAFNVQDTGADEKLSAFLSMSGRLSSSGKSEADSSNNDIAKSINDRTSGKVDPEFLANAMNSQTAESNYIDEKSKKTVVDMSKITAKDVIVSMQLNNKFIGRLITSAASDAAGIYADEMEELVPVADKIQSNTIGLSLPGSLKKDEYDIVIEPARARLFDSNAEVDTYANVIGYIIDKYERKDTGEITKIGEIVIENSTATTYIDTEVKYGATYMYQIRVIAQIEFQSFSDDMEDIMSITSFGTSKPSRKSVVSCTETKPPPPPSDFKPVWDYTENKLYLMWNFPVNPQRDIKKFQVFRRKVVTEAFELVAMLDFDDSEVLSAPRETIDQHRILFSEQPILSFCDDDFTMNTEYIYTLCSIDARNYTSNYGVQLHVSFDIPNNRIVTKVVSPAGAPKSYPNIYLNEDLFVDTIKVSNRSRMHIYFDPEYLEVLGSDGDALDLLQTKRRGKGGSYQLQLVNLDHQKEQKITISVDDIRPVGRDYELSELEKIRRRLNKRRRRARVKGFRKRKR